MLDRDAIERVFGPTGAQLVRLVSYQQRRISLLEQERERLLDADAKETREIANRMGLRIAARLCLEHGEAITPGQFGAAYRRAFGTKPHAKLYGRLEHDDLRRRMPIRGVGERKRGRPPATGFIWIRAEACALILQGESEFSEER